MLLAAALRLQKIPVVGLVPESSGTAPSSPANGQLWTDTSVTPKVVRVYDGAGWVPLNIYAGTTAASYTAGNDARVTGAEQVANRGATNGYAALSSGYVPFANIPTGASGTTVTVGNDSRLSDQRVPTDGSVTGGTAGAGVKLAAATITDVNVAAANKDGSAAVASMRTLGTGAAQAVAGNDARLADTRTPTAGSVVDASVSASAAIAESKLALASDAAAGVASRRTLGTGATQAASGTDARLTDQRVPTDASVTGGTAGAGVKIAAGTITDANVALANKDGVSGTASLRTLGFGAQQALAGNTRHDQIAVPTADVAWNNFRITGLGAPVAASDAARLSDIQAAQAGIDSKPSVRVRATANITVATPGATIDGVTMVAGDRVLLTGQTTTTENDIWIWNGAAVAMTRSVDSITSNSFVFIEEGASTDTQWVLTNNGVITRGTTVQVWSQFGAPGSVSGTTNRITATSGVIDISASYVGQSSLTTLGTVTTGAWAGTSIPVANGGTGAATAAAARTNLGTPQFGYAATLGAVTAGTPLVVTHNLGTQDVIAQVRDASTNEYVYLDVINASTTTVTVTAGIAYAANALRIVILPVA